MNLARPPLRILCTFVLLAAVWPRTALAQGGWAARAPLPVPTIGPSAATLNGLIHLVGGPTSVSCEFSTAHRVFDPIANTWTDAAPMHVQRLHAGAAVLDDGLLYVVGGSVSCAEQTASLEVYDPVTDTWTMKAPMPGGARYGVGAAGINGRLYVIGGIGTSGPNGAITDRVEVYDPVTDTWATETPMPTVRYSMIVGAIDGILYAGGGGHFIGSITDLDAFDPATHAWTSRAPLPLARTYAETIVAGGLLYAIGGETAQAQFQASVDVYDPTSNTWSAGTPLPSPRSESGAAALNGRLYVFGGYGDPNSQTSTLESNPAAPYTTATASPAANANGWNNTDVAVTLHAAAPSSPVQTIVYALNGALNGGATVSGDTAGFTINAEGITVVTYHAVNADGDVEPDETMTIRIDKTAPLVLGSLPNVTLTATSSAGAGYSFALTGSDALSGVASISASPLASGAIYPIGTTHETITAVDRAGNSASAAFDVTVLNPVTLQSVSVSPSSATLSPGGNTTFQAIGHFSDGSSQPLPSAGGPIQQNGPSRPVWSVQFVSAQIDVSACATPQSPAPLTFSSQAMIDQNGAVHEVWSPGTPVLAVDGSISPSDVSLTLVCTNSAASGSISAHWTGTRYEGTYTFNGGASAGTVQITGWSSHTPMPAARFSLTAATVNGVVYALGGGDPSQPSPVFAYTPGTDSWATVGSMQTPREGAGAAAIGGLIYVVGGHVSGGIASGVLESYEPGTNTWTSLTPMPTPRAHLAVVTDGTYVYALGGDTLATNAGVVSTAERYDPASDSWTTLAPMPSPGNFITAGVLGDTIVVAGSGGNSSPTNHTDLYDIGGNAWRSGAPMPAARSMMASGVANGGMYVFGGTVNGSNSYETWVYYPAVFPPALNAHSDYWSGVGSMLTARSQLGAAVAGDVVYALGGFVAGTNPAVQFATNEALSTPPVNTYAPGASSNPLPTVTWQSSNTSVASIDASGNAHANNNPGQTTISATTSTGMSCSASSSCATLTVADTTPPFLSLPNSMTIEANSPSGATFTYFASANDSVDGSRVVNCDHPSGSIFPFGPTLVTCSASDNSGNTATGSFTITVRDTHAPFLNIPSGTQTREATSPGGATVTYFASANDSVDGSVPVTCTPASGSLFGFGSTMVNCSATDAHGNTAHGSFTVLVQDTHAPFLNIPSGTQTREATSPSGATVTFFASANDSVDGSVPVTCTPASGSLFGFGSTTVNCSATDAHGNTAHGSFTVLVQDTHAPFLNIPSGTQTREATSPSGATVTFFASANDSVDGSVPVACTPASGSLFGFGSTTVNCSATDAHGNTAHGSFTVLVQDTTAPSLFLPGPITVVATSASGAAVTFVASATDIVDGSRPVMCTPASGSTFAIGATLVACSASDTHGNTAGGSFTVTVQPPPLPGRMNGDASIDNGSVKQTIVFQVQEHVSGAEAGAFRYRIKTARPGRDQIDEFEATLVTEVTFVNAPGVSPGKRPASGVDTVSFAGVGTWNGQAGYSFTATAVDAGEPGAGRDSIAIVVTDSANHIVASVNAIITGGNIQSLRALP